MRKLATLVLALLIAVGTTTLVFAQTRGGSSDGRSAAVAQYGCPNGTGGTNCVPNNPPPGNPQVAVQTAKVTHTTIAVAGLRRACISRSMRVRLSVGAAGGLRSVRVYLDGRRILTTKRSRFVLRISARTLRPGRHRLKTVVVDGSGRRTTKTRLIARCAKAKPRRQTGPRFTG
jgi:hypothetical protein